MMGVSSFYTYLQYRYPRILFVNPFKGRKLPRIVGTRKKDFPTIEDIKRLRKEFVSLKMKDLVCVVDILSKYGYRIGIFENMKIYKDGRFVSTSKGRQEKDKFTMKEVKQITESGVLKKGKGLLQRTFLRYTTKLYKAGEISCDFSVHDLRRFVFHEGGNKAKNFNEFQQFSRRFHRDVRTTAGYL
jgi:hypothetical protein